MKKLILPVLMVFIVLSILFSTCLTYAVITDTATVDKMMALVEKQNFGGIIEEDAIKSYITHFLYDSNFAAIHTKPFPYPNSGNYVATVSDGTYTRSGINGKGCFAYSKFASLVIYGKAGSARYHSEPAKKLTGDALKTFLLSEAQAGEHLRINSTHSVTFLAGDANGFYYTHYLGDSYGKKIVFDYDTYAEFASRYNGIAATDRPSSIWLYNANPSKNEEKIVEKKCEHPSYNNFGRCASCGKEFEIKISSMSPTKYETVKKDVPVRNRPYSPETIIRKLAIGTKVTVIASGKNSLGNLWFQLSDKTWIFSGNLKKTTESQACKHTAYDDYGKCKSCGKEYPMAIKSMSATVYQTVKDDVPVRNRPYSPETIIKNLSKDTKVTVVASGTNSAGNLWYKLDDGTWIFSGNLKAYKPTPAPTPTPAATPAIANGTYTISSQLNHGYVVDISDGSKNNQANVQLWPSNGTNAQTFKVTHIGNGYYQIVNTNSGRALDAQNGATEPGTNVWQYDINNTDAQIWKIVSAGNSTYSIINKKSGLYLDVDNGAVASGTNIKIWTSNGSDAQKWRFNKVSTTSSTTTPAACKHTSYDEYGKCKSCGKEYPMSINSMSATKYETVKKDVPVRNRPYSPEKIIRTLAIGTRVTVVASGKNSAGNLWYKLSDNTWIYSENLKKVPDCTHSSYDDYGKCKNCGKEYPMSISSMPATKYETVKKDVPVRNRPYSPEKIIRTLAIGTRVTVVASGKNSAGNLWYKLSDNTWIYSGNLKKVPDCTHSSYDDYGKCKSCGKEYPMSVKSMTATTYTTVKDDVPVRNRPYSPEKIIKKLPKGTKVTVVASGTNSAGNLWYKLKDGTWIFSGNLKK